MTIISTAVKNPRILLVTSQREGMWNTTGLTLSVQQREPGWENEWKKPTQQWRIKRVISEACDPAGDLQNGREEFRIMLKRQRGEIYTDLMRFGVSSFLQWKCFLYTLWSQEAKVGLGSVHHLCSREQIHWCCSGLKTVWSQHNPTPGGLH